MDVNSTPSAVSVAPTAIFAAEQSPAVPEIDDLRRRLLEHIIESSEPVRAPALWGRFGSKNSVRRFSCEPRELLSRLGQHFTADQLLAVRAAVRTRSGELEVSKALATDQAFLIRPDPASRVAGDVASQRRKLSSGKREWRELAAATTDERPAPRTPVVLCVSDGELYLLARFGVRCTPMAGVDQLNSKLVGALFKTRPQHAQQRRHQIVLLGWQPDALVNEPSAQNLAAIRHVAAIQLIYGLDPHIVFSVWLPSGVELARIRHAHSFVDLAIVAEAFKSSLSNSLYAPADALALLADRKPSTWSTARAVLLSAVERSTLVPRLPETSIALEKLECAFQAEVLTPLESAPVKKGSPRLRSMMAVDIAAQWYEELELVEAARRLVAGQFPGYAKRVDGTALKRKLQLVNAFVKVVGVEFGK